MSTTKKETFQGDYQNIGDNKIKKLANKGKIEKIYTKYREEIKKYINNLQEEIKIQNYIHDIDYMIESEKKWRNTIYHSPNKIKKLKDLKQEAKNKLKELEKTASENSSNQQETANEYILQRNYITRQELAENVFEGNQTAFNALMKQLYGTSQISKVINQDNANANEKKFLERLNIYEETNDTNKITEVIIGKGSDFSGTRVEKAERAIKYKKNNNEVYNAGGTVKNLQEIISKKYNTENFIGDNFENIKYIENTYQNSILNSKINTQNNKTNNTIPNLNVNISINSSRNTNTKSFNINLINTKFNLKKNINLINKKFDFEKKIETKQETNRGINAFDDRGNFVTFEKYIQQQGAKYVKKNLSTIINQIKNYQPVQNSQDFKDGYINELKNGYATVLTDYIIKTNDSELTDLYITYLTPDNLNILGTDQASRIENYNKLIRYRNDSGYRNTLGRTKSGIEQQKKLIDLRQTIENKPKLTPQETLSKGLDAMIKTFGPMLFSILKMFGIGKKTLLTMFKNSKDKINKIFNEEYGLEDEAKDSINDIIASKKNDGTLNFSDTEFEKPIIKPKNLQKQFFGNNKDANFYTNILLKTEKKYYQNININVLSYAVNLYNKSSDNKININDLVKIKIDKTTGKKSIEEVKDKNKLQEVINLLIQDEDIRSRIAAANQEIQTENTKDDIPTGYNEQGISKSERPKYLINSNQDIARYLTAALFSDKDLGYVMTENELHNNKEYIK